MSNATTARAPVTPLILHDPSMSVWSFGDTLTDSWPKHWTGKEQQMSGLLHVDGKPFRFMGRNSHMVAPIPAMLQLSREVTLALPLYAARCRALPVGQWPEFWWWRPHPY